MALETNLAVYDVHALVCGRLTNLWMAVTYIRVRYSELARRTEERTEVGNTDTACEVEQLLAALHGNPRALSLIEHILRQLRQTLVNMLLAKSYQGLGRCRSHRARSTDSMEKNQKLSRETPDVTYAHRIGAARFSEEERRRLGADIVRV